MATIPELFDSLKAYINSVISDKITIINTKTTEAESSASRAKTSETNAKTSENNAASAAATAVTNAVNELKGGAPAAFDTLGEIADELAANQTLHASMLNQIADAAQTAQWSQVSGTPLLSSYSDGTSSYANRIVTFDDNGFIRLGSDPTSGTHLARKSYVDSQIGTRAPSSHTHTIPQVSGLETALDSKQPKSQTMTQAAYDALPTKDPNVTYNIIAG